MKLVPKLPRSGPLKYSFPLVLVVPAGPPLTAKERRELDDRRKALLAAAKLSAWRR